VRNNMTSPAIQSTRPGTVALWFAAMGLAAITATGIVLATPSAALAHDALASADPAAESTSSSELTSIALTFNEAPLGGLQSGVIIQVIDPSGTDVSMGDVQVNDRVLSKAVTPSTKGQYQVAWRTVSADGHPISGQYEFAYAGPLAATPTLTATPLAKLTAEPAPTPSTAAATGNNSVSPGPDWPIVSVVATIATALVLTAIFAVRVRKRANRN
jgi:copper resistance protein C